MAWAKPLTIAQAAQRLADLTQAHLATVSPQEREVRLRAFRRVVARVRQRTHARRGR